MVKLDKIEDIRFEIDKIDLKILNLISERKDLVTKIVKYKNRDQIVDKKRIDEILFKLSFEAKKRGISESLVKELWESMINSFISYEEELFDKESRS